MSGVEIALRKCLQILVAVASSTITERKVDTERDE